jgi:hypothetical protein
MTTRWLGSFYYTILIIAGGLLMGVVGPSASLPLLPAQTAQAALQTVLQPGDTGAEVRQLQTALAELDFYGGMVDGLYGADTAQAVQSLQQYQGLEVDGMVGEQTWQAVATLQRRRAITLPPPMLGAELWTFTPFLVAQPAPPPAAFWLALMPLVPITGGTLTCLKRRVQRQQERRQRLRRQQQQAQGKPPLRR